MFRKTATIIGITAFLFVTQRPMEAAVDLSGFTGAEAEGNRAIDALEFFTSSTFLSSKGEEDLQIKVEWIDGMDPGVLASSTRFSGMCLILFSRSSAEHLESNDITLLMIHELAHCFGVGHTDNEESIMCPIFHGSNTEQGSLLSLNEAISLIEKARGAWIHAPY